MLRKRKAEATRLSAAARQALADDKYPDCGAPLAILNGYWVQCSKRRPTPENPGSVGSCDMHCGTWLVDMCKDEMTKSAAR